MPSHPCLHRSTAQLEVSVRRTSPPRAERPCAPGRYAPRQAPAYVHSPGYGLDVDDRAGAACGSNVSTARRGTRRGTTLMKNVQTRSSVRRSSGRSSQPPGRFRTLTRCPRAAPRRSMDAQQLIGLDEPSARRGRSPRRGRSARRLGRPHATSASKRARQHCLTIMSILQRIDLVPGFGAERPCRRAARSATVRRGRFTRPEEGL
jgi:hypothetical protein